MVKKVVSQIISSILVVIFVTGNLIGCTKNEPTAILYTGGDSTEFYAIADGEYKKDNLSYEQIPIDFIASDDFISRIEDKFKGQVEDIFVTSISVAALPEIENLIDPEHKLDIKKIAANLAIGGVIVLVCVLMPAVAPGLSSAVATAFLAVPKQALLGAAVDTAISGIISYVKNKGDLNEVLYDSIEAGAEGFKYGAIFGAATSTFSAIKASRTAKRGVNAFVEVKPTNITKAEGTSVFGAKTSLSGEKWASKNLVTDTKQFSRSAVKGLGKADFIKKYGQQAYDDLYAYTGKEFRQIQTYLRTGIGSPETKARAERLVNFLQNQTLNQKLTLYRGDNISPDTLAEIFGLHNVRGKTPDQLAQMLKIEKPASQSGALMSTSKGGGMNTVKVFATSGSGKPNPDNIKIIREIKTSEATKGIDISGISKIPHQQEVLLQTGTKTKVVDAYTELVVSGGKQIEVIHIVEEVL